MGLWRDLQRLYFQGQMREQELLGFRAKTATSCDMLWPIGQQVMNCAASLGSWHHSRPTDQPHIKHQLALPRYKHPSVERLLNIMGLMMSCKQLCILAGDGHQCKDNAPKGSQWHDICPGMPCQMSTDGKWLLHHLMRQSMRL